MFYWEVVSTALGVLEHTGDCTGKRNKAKMHLLHWSSGSHDLISTNEMNAILCGSSCTTALRLDVNSGEHGVDGRVEVLDHHSIHSDNTRNTS